MVFCEIRKTLSVSFVVASMLWHNLHECFSLHSKSKETSWLRLTVHYTFFLFYGNPIQHIVWALFSACGVSTWALFLLDSVECSELCFYARGSCFTNIWLLWNYFATIIYFIAGNVRLRKPTKASIRTTVIISYSKTSTAQLNYFFCFEVRLLVVVDCLRGISPSFISFNSFPQF